MFMKHDLNSVVMVLQAKIKLSLKYNNDFMKNKMSALK